MRMALRTLWSTVVELEKSSYWGLSEAPWKQQLSLWEPPNGKARWWQTDEEATKTHKEGELQFQDLATTPFPLWSYERLQRRRKKVAAESQTSETWRGGCSGGRWQAAFPYGWCFWVDHHLNPHLLCQCLKGLPSRAAFILNGGLDVGHPTSL